MFQVTISHILRYILSSSYFLLVAIFAYEVKTESLPKTILSLNPNDAATLALIAVSMVFLGAIVYTIHRAVFNPFLFVFSASFAGHNGENCCNMINRLDVQRWRNRGISGNIQHNTEEWASQIHLLCTCIFMGFLAYVICSCYYDWPHGKLYSLFWATQILLVIATLFHSIRLARIDILVNSHDEEILNNDNNPSEGTATNEGPVSP